MKKLRLEIETLAVESFATAPKDGAARGTVHGRGTDASTCDPRYACGCGDSWEGSCDCAAVVALGVA